MTHKFKIGNRVIWHVDGLEDDLGTIVGKENDIEVLVLLDKCIQTSNRTEHIYRNNLKLLIDGWEIWKKLNA